MGPHLLANALPKSSTHLQLHFVSTLDGKQALQLMPRLNSETTVFIVVSKTFTTQDTLTNAKTLRSWFMRTIAEQSAWQKHFFAVSVNSEAMHAFGILPAHQFKIWDWVGGRYSLWSAVSLSVMLYLGVDTFLQLLKGAMAMDEHFQSAPLTQNMPVLLALLDVWYVNFFAYHTRVVLPYDSLLMKLPDYLRQLEMESCGKGVDCAGRPLDYDIGPIIWGDLGNHAQHAFAQWLYQARQTIPVDFIVSRDNPESLPQHRNLALANALAMSRALMLGKQDGPAYSHCRGNSPSTFISYETLTAKTLGALIALYEHKVFVKSVIWDINPFDQWGVELGKTIAKTLLQALDAVEDTADLDGSTRGLLAQI